MSKKFLFITLFLISSLSPSFADSIASQKGYAASILGGHLCYLRKGRITKQSFVLNVENLMLKKGYDIDYLYNDKVRKAGKLIANKLGSNCADESILRDEGCIYLLHPCNKNINLLKMY